jgi:hypothetical protein
VKGGENVISKERAEEIRATLWRNMQGSGSGGETPQERAEIMRFWSGIGGENSYYDAVARLARGER